MHKVLLMLILPIVVANTTTAQNAALNCGNGRYINDVFPTVSKTSGIVFGYNTSTDYITSTTFNNTLLLDFYGPAADPAGKRPLIILAFGGSFISGQRSDMDALCMAFSKKGYATATIDYRLIQPGPSGMNYSYVYSNSTLLNDEIIKATADMKAAIRFFKRDAATANTYKIDTSKIFIGGFSAGAITALQTAYINNINEYPAVTPQFQANGGFEGNTDLPAPNNLLPTYHSTGIAGVLNLAGGVADTLLINATDPPVYTAQGDNDDVVPYTGGTSALYGGLLIHSRANHIGLASQLYTIAGGSHTSPVSNPYFSVVVAGASAFFAPIVCTPIILPVTLTFFNVENQDCDVVLRWQTTTEQQSSSYDMETSEDGIHFKKIGSLQSKNAAGGATYSYHYKANTGTSYFRLKMVNKDGSFTYSPVQKFTTSCGAIVQIYPNPAHEGAAITGLQAGMQVYLINSVGQSVWAQKSAGSTMQLPLTAFANGLYLVQVTDNYGKIIMNSKLIKK